MTVYSFMKKNEKKNKIFVLPGQKAYTLTNIYIYC